MELNNGLVFTNDGCVGCNRCISVCPILGTNVVVDTERGKKIAVDGEKCLHCGRCLGVCQHEARDYVDDTSAFFNDLKKGDAISVLVDISFFAEYGYQAEQVIGHLKDLGVRHIYDASYGTDLSAWAHLMYMEEHPTSGVLPNQCSCVTSYMERYANDLMNQVVPIMTPVMCLATFLKKYKEYDEKLAYISPCIAKKDEFSHEKNSGIVSYNVTYDKLMKWAEEEDISGATFKLEQLETILGGHASVATDLGSALKRFMSKDKLVRRISGVDDVYRYLINLEEKSLKSSGLPDLLDCKNCKGGCQMGSATGLDEMEDDFLIKMHQLRNSMKDENSFKDPYDETVALDERIKRLKAHFAGLDYKLFSYDYEMDAERYKDFKQEASISEDELEEVYLEMGKFDEESRCLNCGSCGCGTCREMAIAVYHGYMEKEECTYYLKDLNLRIAMTDLRTGIPNYHAFTRFTDSLIKECNLNGFVGIYFDLTNLNLINQKYGFQVGDQVIVNFSDTVRNLAENDEIIALLGGNHFAGIIRREHLQEVLDSLESVPVNVDMGDGTEAILTINSFVAVYLPDGKDTNAQVIIEKLTSASQAVADRGQAKVIYYKEQYRRQQLLEEDIVQAIDPGLEKHEFRVYYQPKVNMDNNKIIGAEALIRWERDGKLVSPMDFIPICEKYGFVEKLDYFVLEEVCSHIATWIEQGIEPVPVSVNFSKNHFSRDTVAEKIDSVANKWKLPKELLEIEFTETAYLDGEKNLIDSIDKLHACGIASSMDDFGTGYSSLSMLQNMSFDTLKLDKAFLDGMNVENQRYRTVIGHIINMAKELNMKIVSEGIETMEELEYMKELNCDIAQGYFFDKPLPHDEFESRLRSKVYDISAKLLGKAD